MQARWLTGSLCPSTRHIPPSGRSWWSSYTPPTGADARCACTMTTLVTITRAAPRRSLELCIRRSATMKLLVRFKAFPAGAARNCSGTHKKERLLSTWLGARPVCHMASWLFSVTEEKRREGTGWRSGHDTATEGEVMRIWGPIKMPLKAPPSDSAEKPPSSQLNTRSTCYKKSRRNRCSPCKFLLTLQKYVNYSETFSG